MLIKRSSKPCQLQSRELVKPLSKILEKEGKLKDVKVVEEQSAPQRPNLNLKLREDYEEFSASEFLYDLESWLREQDIYDEGEEEDEIRSWVEINYAETPHYEKVKRLVARRFDVYLDESMGGVSAPMATLTNVPGSGTSQPASTAATSGSQQNSPDALGSGDRWDNKTLRKKKKKKRKVDEMNINPHDQIGVMMAKKMNVPLAFEKGKGDQDVKQRKISNEGSHKIMDYKTFANLVKEK